MRYLTLLLLLSKTVFCQTDSIPKTPFPDDYSWMNGQNRQTSNLLQSKYFTGSVIFDTYYNFSFNKPLDNTINTSATVGRHNEFTINMATVGFETNYKNIIGRVLLQTGSMVNLVQENDLTTQRGRNLSTTNMKLIREAVAGYHWNKGYGLNFEMGVFMSFIGLESYLTQENWNYQRAYISEFTPFYFSGARLQYYPSKNLKLEPWIMNGWQSYGKWNKGFSSGFAVNYRIGGKFSLFQNLYYGTDTKDDPSRVRYHIDYSFLYKFYERNQSKGLSRIATSLNTQFGFEDKGNGPPKDSTYLAGFSLATRFSFSQNTWALTFRGGMVTNPGRYAAIAPTPGGFVGTTPGDISLKANEFTSTLDIMPNDYVTFRLEFLTRHANIPYFAGPGGTTSPDGWQGTPGSFVPDLRKFENRVTFAVNFRI